MSSAVAASSFDFHGLPVQLAYRAFPGDPLRALLSCFEGAPARTPQIRVELSADPQHEISAPGPDWLATFCHGLAQGYTRRRHHRLSDGASLVELEPEHGILRGTLRAPVSELASGMLHVGLCLLLREHGIFDAHAAVACAGKSAFVIMGDAGSGKTSTLLALLSAGATYLGDDRVLLRAATEGVELLGYPRDFHLTTETLQAHPALGGGRAPAAIDGKVRVDPQRAFPARFQPHFSGEITLLSPFIGEQETSSLVALSSAEAFGELLGASATVALEVLPHRDTQLATLKQLANSASAFRLRLGHDLLREPERAGSRLLQLLEGGRG